MTAEEESVQVDAYLNGLLAGRHGTPRGLGAADGIDPELEATANLVQRALARFHPSFTFEERLAAQLAAIAGGRAESRGDRLPVAQAIAVPVALASRRRAGDLALADEEPRPRTGLLRGGAIASGVSIAGVSIAGAALLVRRRSRPSTPAEAAL